MSIRNARKAYDSQKCIYQAIKKKCDNNAPFTSWTPILSYPQTDIWNDHESIIYLEDPVNTDVKWHQGGRNMTGFNMMIGAWTVRKTGGEEEVIIMADELVNLFTDHKALHQVTFDVTTDNSYSDTTLNAQGVQIQNISVASGIETEGLDGFRKRLTLSYIV